MPHDLVIDISLIPSCIVAFAWMIGNPLIIWYGYYMRDRSKDDE